MARHNHKRKKPTTNENRQVQAADPSYDKKTRTYAVIPPEEKSRDSAEHHQVEPCVKIEKGRHGC